MYRIDQNQNIKSPRKIDISKTAFSAKNNDKTALFHQETPNDHSFMQELKQRQDFRDVLQFAEFIGLSSVNVIKRRVYSRYQRFLKTHNFSTAAKQPNTKQMIKNKLQNRNINYFDLKRLWDQRCDRLRLQNCRKDQQQKLQKIKNNLMTKDRRALSAKNICSSMNSSDKLTIQKFSDLIQSSPDLKSLRIKTARQITERKQQRFEQQKQLQRYVQKVHNQKVVRSRILNDISRSQTKECQEIVEIKYDGWKKAQNSNLKQRGVSAPSKIEQFMKESELTKQNSIVNLSSRIRASPKHFEISNFKFSQTNPESILIIGQTNRLQDEGIDKSNQKITSSLLIRNTQISSPAQRSERSAAERAEQSPAERGGRIRLNLKRQIDHRIEAEFVGQRIKGLQKISQRSKNAKIYISNRNKTRLRLNKQTNLFEFSLK